MVTLLEQIAQHLKRLGPQGDYPPGPGQRIELGIEETIGEDVAHGAILRAGPVLLAAPYAGFGGVGGTGVHSIPEKGGLVTLQGNGSFWPGNGQVGQYEV